MLAKVSIHTLAAYDTPPGEPLADGGRIMTPAGELAQIVSGRTFAYLAYLEFQHQPERGRGNHYHLLKHETLYVIKGHLWACLHDIDTGEQMETPLQTGDMITMAPRCSHVFYPQEYTQAVEFSATPYDPTDTYRHAIPRKDVSL